MIITPQNTVKAQYEFSMVDPRKYKHPGLIGGVGSGKTRAIPLRWIKLIDWRAKHQKLKCKMMVIEPTKEMIRDILVPEMNDFFDTHGISHIYHKTYHNYEITYKKHSFTALFRSSDEPASLTGKSITDFVIDEFDKKHPIPHQKEVWNECIARLRKAEFATGGVTTTSEGYKYTYELFGECEYREKKNFKLIRAKTYDNQFLPKDYIENLYDQYSKELVEQYIEAKFVNLTQGKVYYGFDRDKSNTDETWNRNYPLKVMCDFNVNPMKWAIGQEIGKEIYIIGQVVEHNTYTQSMARTVGEKYGFETYYQIYGDYSGTARSTKARTTDYEIIQSILTNSEVFIQPNPSIQDRINAVNSLLCNSRNVRRLFVNIKECPDVVKDFEQVVWHKTKREPDQLTNHDLTHISSGIGYYAEYDHSLKGRIRSKQW